MTKGLIEQYRDDIIIGSACAAGEVYRAILSGASHEELLQIADFMITLKSSPAGITSTCSAMTVIRKSILGKTCRPSIKDSRLGG